ncbi:hypothetical protein A2U01_0097177, partial [Trifolium medium]|nr:hypothetical protein [Trifolium medium]
MQRSLSYTGLQQTFTLCHVFILVFVGSNQDSFGSEKGMRIP